MLFTWKRDRKQIISKVLVRFARTIFLSAAVLRILVDQHDAKFMIILVQCLFLGGIILSTFEEYLLLATAVTISKPTYLTYVAIHADPSNSIPRISHSQLCTMIEHHALLLLMGIAVNWFMHCDRRRKWLTSQRRPLLMHGRPATTSSPGDPSAGACMRGIGAWDPLDDGYGSDGERAELAALVREEAAAVRAREPLCAPADRATEPAWRRTDRLVGVGPAGRVFHARVPGAAAGDRSVVKVLRPAEPPEAERAPAERRLCALAAVRHANLVEYRGAALRGGGVALLAGLCDGGSLERLLARRGALGEAEARRLGRDVAEGLAFLHRHGAAHLRLTCANVLLSAAGAARLSDYATAGAAAWWRDGASLGTAVAFAAPEVLRGAPCGRQVSLRS